MPWQRTGLFLFVQVAVAGCQLLSPEVSMHVLDKCHGRDISLPLTFCAPHTGCGAPCWVRWEKATPLLTVKPHR